jgi:hypothetical protein
MILKPADFIELSIFLPSRIQSMVGKSNTHHLKMLDDHLVDMLIAMVLRCSLRIVIKEEDVHDKKKSLEQSYSKDEGHVKRSLHVVFSAF